MTTTQQEIRFFCPLCEFRNKISLPPSGEISCANCRAVILRSTPNLSETFQCFLCGHDQFHLAKDFNRGLGLAIFLAGAIASIWTYGVSLAIAALIDAYLYKRLPFVKVCYVCDCEYKGGIVLPRDKAYDHALGDLIRPVKEDWQLGKRKQFDGSQAKS